MGNKDSLGLKVRVCYGTLAAGAGAAVIMIFYQSWPLAAAAAVLAFLLFPEFCRKSIEEKKKRKLVREFREVLYSLITALRAGRSLEQALIAVGEDMDPAAAPLLYPKWQLMLGRLQVNVTAESCLKELARDCGIEEIESLAEVIDIGRRSQGNMVEIIENTVRLLQDKIEIQEEVHLLLTKKRLEQKIINFMPFCVLGMLLMISPEYLSPLYGSIRGRIIMSACLGLAAGSLILSRHIAEIEI